MADFYTAYKTVRANEGGYRNVSWDAGGETYKGIARKFWPAWAGWKIIDEYKKKHTLKTGDYIESNELDTLVHEFFKANFWAKNNLNYLKNQSLATLGLDMAINHGKGPKLINEAVAKISAVPIDATVNTKAIQVMNDFPEQSYKNIAASRVAYVESLKTQLGPDYNAVLARAKSFLTKYSASAAAVGGLILLAAAFFF